MTEMFIPDLSGLDTVLRESAVIKSEVTPNSWLTKHQQLALDGLSRVAEFKKDVDPADNIRRMFGIEIEDIAPAA